LLAGKNADVTITDFAKMNGKFMEGLVLKSRKTKGFNVKKKSEGFFFKKTFRLRDLLYIYSYYIRVGG
jgi:hypothetical protein